MAGEDVDDAVDAVHNEAPANGTVVPSHRRADCRREYCRTVMGLFEETRGQQGGGLAGWTRGEKIII